METTFAPVKPRQDGGSRYDHSQRVADRVKGWGDRDYMVGLLHDVFEDSGLPHEVVRTMFGDAVYEDVLVLTHDDDSIAYAAYIEHIATEGSDTAVRVKLADLQDNLHGPDEPWHLSLRTRYERAQRRLLAELTTRGREAVWRYIGTPGEPAFENGWGNRG